MSTLLIVLSAYNLIGIAVAMMSVHDEDDLSDFLTQVWLWPVWLVLVARGVR